MLAAGTTKLSPLPRGSTAEGGEGVDEEQHPASTHTPDSTAEQQDGTQAQLSRALDAVRLRYGEHVVRRAGTAAETIQTISSGSLGLDRALRTGGFPRGRLVEVFGGPSSGKTTLALTTVAGVLRRGGEAAYVDAEHAFDAAYAQRLGIDFSRLLINRPAEGAEALGVAALLTESGAMDLVVLDSLAALDPGGGFADAPGEQARLLGQGLRRLVGAARKTATLLVLINQVREGPQGTYTPGGMALRYFASARVRLEAAGSVLEDGQIVGRRVRARVVKNKLGAPHGEAAFDLRFDTGLCTAGEVFDLALERGVLRRSGSVYRWGRQALGAGRATVVRRLREEKELLLALRREALTPTAQR